MKPVNITAQTCNGECLSACIASLLETEDSTLYASDAIYNPHDALQRAQLWLNDKGFFLAENGHRPPDNLPRNLCTITAFADRRGVYHYFVGKPSLPITFDPHGGCVNAMPVADFLARSEGPQRWLFLAPFNPAPKPEVPMGEKPIFVASPYGHPSPCVRTKRAAEVAAQALKLMDAGFIVYAPICHSHPINATDRGRDYAFWMRQSLALLRVCGALVVADIDGWQESKGVREEMAFARSLGMPTYIGLNAFLSSNKRP